MLMAGFERLRRKRNAFIYNQVVICRIRNENLISDSDFLLNIPEAVKTRNDQAGLLLSRVIDQLDKGINGDARYNGDCFGSLVGSHASIMRYTSAIRKVASVYAPQTMSGR